jgi:hypothetical protein
MLTVGVEASGNSKTIGPSGSLNMATNLKKTAVNVCNIISTDNK